MNLSYSFFQRINLFSIWFLVTFGILVNISASSVQGLNQFNDNFYFIKRHISAVLIGILIFNEYLTWAMAIGTSIVIFAGVSSYILDKPPKKIRQETSK